MRLISTVSAQVQLLEAIRAVPADQKLCIPALRDALLNQGDVIRGILTLIAAGELDPATLRPLKRDTEGASGAQDGERERSPDGGMANGPISEREARTPDTAPLTNSNQASEPAPGALPTDSAQLARFLIEVGQRQGLKPTHVAHAVFGNKTQLFDMLRRKPGTIVRSATLRRAELWVRGFEGSTPASSPPVCDGGGVAEAKAPPSSPSITGADLAARLDRLLADNPAITKSSIGMAIESSPGGLERLRKVKTPTARMIAKVERILADPPSPRSATKQSQRADPTCPPVAKPLPTEVSAAVRQSAVRRSYTTQAKRLLEREQAGKPTPNVHPSVRMAAANLKSQQEAEARKEDPVEQAKLALRRRGKMVFDAAVSEGSKGEGFFYVGSKRVSRDELLEMADPAPRQTASPPAPPAPPRSTALAPTDRAWCDQCDQRVSGIRAAECTSPFCSLKKGAA